MDANYLKNINRSMQNWFYYLFVCLIDFTIWFKKNRIYHGKDLIYILSLNLHL